jgi:predicted CoA-substrate-specific enzyme activase
MRACLGLDVGAVGVKAALVMPPTDAIHPASEDGFPRSIGFQLRAAKPASNGSTPPHAASVFVSRSRRTRGRPVEAVRDLLAELFRELPELKMLRTVVTGSGGALVAAALGARRVNEFQALARAVSLLHPEARSVFEMGGETSKYILLEPDPADGRLNIVDYGTNGDCAAGTGSFLDQQAGRLRYHIEEIGPTCAAAARCAQIAGRCSVFAKSDMIHAQQKGFTPPEVLRGLCKAMATNYRSAVAKGRTPVAPVLFLGGVAANRAVVQELREAFGLQEHELIVPEAAESFAAIGAALMALDGYATAVPAVLGHHAGVPCSKHCSQSSDTQDEEPVSIAASVDCQAPTPALPRSTGGGSNGAPSASEGARAPSAIEAAGALNAAEGNREPSTTGGPIEQYKPLTTSPTGLTTRLFDSLTDAVETQGRDLPTTAPLDLSDVVLLRDRAKPYAFPKHDSRADVAGAGHNGRVDAWLGIDIGSVGTKLAVVDPHGAVIHSIFTRTEGRPIEVVTRILGELQQAVGERIRIRGTGTTGSGRELIGELVGADAITDEITCHKTGATFVGDALLGRRPDTIFEIGGQDSKYISLAPEGGGSGDTVVVDFTMNEACAAGTGSFLEERAAELGVAIKGEFSQLALQSKAPIRLGERCTVFMERDVNTYMQRGARREDIIAGLAYSVVYNYINRVVRGRPIGDCVFFQGGTAYNDAVAAAFSKVCGKTIIVPPHNAVLGAIGAALVAREKVTATGQATRFRGFDLGRVSYTLKEFTCRGCGNTCNVQEFNVEGEKTYWGDKCSDRYRKRARSERKASIRDLLALRHELLMADEAGPDISDPPHATRTIGIPLAMYTLDLLPLWRRFLRDCGFRVITSSPTDRRTVQAGLDRAVAEPCFPMIAAHGHVADLTAQGADYLWLPNILSAATKFMDNESHVCPWGQTLPFVVREAPAFRAWRGRILCPTIRFREGSEEVCRALVDTVAALGVDRSVARRAYESAEAAQARFRAAYASAGREALDMLAQSGEPGMVLVGRPYNVHDAGVNLSVARKLRDHYGVNVIPIDALPTADIDVRDINDNMFWDYGRKILAAGKIVREHPNLHIIYITNFKCGPDSFLKSYIGQASGKPFLTLQFDGHSNDAGMMTRCEAYLDSKGILRWWRQSRSKRAAAASPAAPSTFRKWRTPVPG